MPRLSSQMQNSTSFPQIQFNFLNLKDTTPSVRRFLRADGLIPSCRHKGNSGFMIPTPVGADLCVRPREGAHAGAPLQELFLLL